MLPILVSIGPIKIYSYGVLIAIGLFLSLYWWWKMGRDEHWDEIVLFDGFFVSLFVFVLVGRVGYVLGNWGELGTLYRFLAIHAFPGISAVWGAIASTIVVILFAREHNWEKWKALDVYSVAVLIMMVFGGIGGFLNGTNPGKVVSWGVMYPGEVEKRIPIDLIVFAFALISFLIVSRVRKNFRFYSWYKGESSTAEPGLAALVFLCLTGTYFFVVSFLMDSKLLLWGRLPAEMVAGLGLIATGAWMINRRVGKKSVGLWKRVKEAKLVWLQKLRKRRI